jgi:hypothetical protein
MTNPFEQAPTGPVYSNTDQGPTTVPYNNPYGATVVLQSPQVPPRRSRGKMIGAVVGVAAILGAGTFALSQLQDNKASGGADSPEKLADELVTALDSEDVLGAIDLLLPGERDTFRQPMIDFVSELRRLQVADDTADLGKVGGIDIQIDVGDVNVDRTNVDDISNVRVTGTSSVIVNGDQLPIGDLIIDQGFNGDRPNLDSESEDDFNLGFTAVSKDGRWYVSLFYSALESARGGLDIPDEGIEPVGASSPEEALDNLIQAGAGLDALGALATLNPNEAEAFQRYAPLIADASNELMDAQDVRVDVSNAKYTVSGSGDTRQVGIESINLDISGGGQSATVELADGCLRVDTPDANPINLCSSSADLDQDISGYLTDAGFTDTQPFEDLINDTRAAFEGFSDDGVVVKKVDGKWYVSPISTGFEFVLSMMRALDRDEIDTLVNDVSNVIDSFLGQAFGSVDDPAADETDFSSWFDCLSETDSTAQQQCIADGVAGGQYSTQDIPAPLLYPECGLFDYYAGYDLYTDSVEDFFATIEPGGQCIIDAAAADSLDLTYLTPEFVKPECFTEVTPYDYANEKYGEASDCVSAG